MGAFRPKLGTTLKGYSKRDFFQDLRAGVQVGIVALPLSIAFGVLSGLSPREGILAAIIAGFLAALLGGSRVQITGPTGASAVIIYGILQQYGREGLILCTILSGVFLMMLGVARLGNLIKFVPRPLTIGFTCSVAVIIFTSQIRDAFGLHMETMPILFADKLTAYAHSWPTWNPFALGMTLAAILIIKVWPRAAGRFARMVPAPFVALVICTAVAMIFKIPVETIESRFGHLSLHPEWIGRGIFSLKLLTEMVRPALAIASLGAMVSLLSAVVGDGMIQGNHRSNTELMAQGIANMASGLFGGMPAQGAVARTATNVRSGAKTPVAGMIHALTLLMILVLFGKLVDGIPMPCLAGILIVVAFRMGEWHELLDLMKEGPKSDAAVLLATFFTGIVFSLTAALEVGIPLSFFLFTSRMASVTQTKRFFEDSETEEAFQLPPVPEGVEIYEVEGALFFASALEFLQTLRFLTPKVRVLILYLRNTQVIDSTGLHYLKLFREECAAAKIHLILAGGHSQPLRALKRAGFFELFGRKNILLKLRSAIERGEALVKDESRASDPGKPLKTGGRIG